MRVAVLGAGPHGRQIASFFPESVLYDDQLVGFRPCQEGADQFPFLIGAAWPKVRQAMFAQLDGVSWQNGNIAWPGVRLGEDITLGVHDHFEYNTVISHGCRIGDFVTLGPGSVLCGEVTVGDGVFIGANATVIHGGIVIGDGATIGAGAVVVDDVPAGATVVGVPARVLR